MKLLALERELSTDSAIYQPHLKDEAAQVWALYLSGQVREIYFRGDQHTAVLVLECDNLAQAHEVLASLPLVRHRLIEFEIMPLSPYDGFARLFQS